MTAIVPTRACLFSLYAGGFAWLYLLCLPFLGAEDAFERNFYLLWCLMLLAAGTLLVLCVGVVPLLLYLACYPTTESKRPLVVRCSLYLLPSFAFELCLLFFAFYLSRPPA